MIDPNSLIQKYDDYKREIIEKNHWTNKELTDTSNNGLKFIFGHTFFRGRKDKLSQRYYDATIKLLELEGEDKQTVPNLLNEDTGVIKEKLKPELDNPKDIDMVISVLDFIRETDNNPYNYLKGIIEEKNGIYKAYYKLDAIKQIGNKIATFIIRDIILINSGSTAKFEEDEYQFMFPVDTWVRKNGKEILREDVINDQDLRIRLIKLCKEEGLTSSDPLAPLKLNVGLWWVGIHSSD